MNSPPDLVPDLRARMRVHVRRTSAGSLKHVSPYNEAIMILRIRRLISATGEILLVRGRHLPPAATWTDTSSKVWLSTEPALTSSWTDQLAGAALPLRVAPCHGRAPQERADAAALSSVPSRGRLCSTLVSCGARAKQRRHPVANAGREPWAVQRPRSMPARALGQRAPEHLFALLSNTDVIFR